MKWQEPSKWNREHHSSNSQANRVLHASLYNLTQLTKEKLFVFKEKEEEDSKTYNLQSIFWISKWINSPCSIWWVLNVPGEQLAWLHSRGIEKPLSSDNYLQLLNWKGPEERVTGSTQTSQAFAHSVQWLMGQWIPLLTWRAEVCDYATW